jgi:hypothetical protein
LAALDDAGELSTLFVGPDWLTADERVRGEREEGWTLGVTSRRPGRISSPPEQIVVMESCDATASECGLPTCGFVYFATPACAPETITAEFVNSAKAIIAHAYNRLGQRMPLVQALRPGDQILLVYGSAGKYRPCSGAEFARQKGRYDWRFRDSTDFATSPNDYTIN